MASQTLSPTAGFRSIGPKSARSSRQARCEACFLAIFCIICWGCRRHGMRCCVRWTTRCGLRFGESHGTRCGSRARAIDSDTSGTTLRVVLTIASLQSLGSGLELHYHFTPLLALFFQNQFGPLIHLLDDLVVHGHEPSEARSLGHVQRRLGHIWFWRSTGDSHLSLRDKTPRFSQCWHLIPVLVLDWRVV